MTITDPRGIPAVYRTPAANADDVVMDQSTGIRMFFKSLADQTTTDTADFFFSGKSGQFFVEGRNASTGALVEGGLCHWDGVSTVTILGGTTNFTASSAEGDLAVLVASGELGINNRVATPTSLDIYITRISF